MAKSYSLSLPVFKQGDDMRGSLKAEGGKVKEGLLRQAEWYEAAASQCRKLAEAVEACPEIEIEADTHFIGVRGPDEVLEKLEAEGVLDSNEYESEDEDDEEEGVDADDGDENEVDVDQASN